MKEIYNLDQLVKIEIIDKREDTSFKYGNEIKFLGLTLRKKGFSFIGQVVSENYIVKNYNVIIDGEKVFYKPCVILYFSNTYCTKRKYFNTYGMANKWAHEIASKNITSKLEIKE